MAREAIFIGYRRDDTADVAGRIYDALARKFGKSRIFKDVDNLRPGADFGEYIKGVLPRCRVALILIGPNWSEARDERGARRLDDANDWVRIEIETVLATPGLDVVPVLVNGAHMPRPEQLPETMQPLLRRHAAVIRRDPDFHDDVGRLIKALQQSVKSGVIDLSAIDGGSWKSSASPESGVGREGKGLVWALTAVIAATAVVAIVLNWDRIFRPRSVDDAPVASTTLAAGESFRDCAYCPEMVVIPAGSFTMGSPESEIGRGSDEGPQRLVSIRQFAAGKFEVTWDQWLACVNRGGCRTIPDDEGWGRGSRPVINIDWSHQEAYIDWLSRETGRSYRLLTEAEWEYAARAGTNTPWSWGDDPNAACRHANLLDGTARDTYAATCSDSVGLQTAPVGRYRANAFGLHDMQGNVSELTQDCYDPTLGNVPTNGSANLTGLCEYRVARGGAWNDNLTAVRSAARTPSPEGDRGNTLGFRVARAL